MASLASGERRGPDLKRVAAHMVVVHQIALQEALRKQQQIDVGRLRVHGELTDRVYRRIDVPKDLRRLTRPDQHPRNLPLAASRVA
jgi:hypothetical protein